MGKRTGARGECEHAGVRLRTGLRRPYLPQLVMPAAHAHIRVVASQLHLASLGDHHAILVKAGHATGCAPAPAHGLDLLDHVGPREQPERTGEEVTLEIGAQTVGDDGDVVVVDDLRQALYLLFGAELRVDAFCYFPCSFCLLPHSAIPMSMWWLSSSSIMLVRIFAASASASER